MKLVFDPQAIIEEIKGLPAKTKKFWSSKKNRRDFLKFETGVLVGLLFWVVLNSLIGLTGLLVGIPLGIFIIICLAVVKFLGLEDTGLLFVNEIVGLVEALDLGGAETTLDIIPAFPNFFAAIIEMLTKLTEALTRLGKAFFENLALMFPILLDINIDLDWLHVSLPYLVRTFFNIVQFVAMYYVLRKIKRKIKRRVQKEIEEKIKLDKMVYFPKMSGK